MSEPLELTPQELVAAAERGEPLQVLDVRAPQQLAAGRLDLVPAERFHNIVGSRLLALDDPEEAGLTRSLPVAVVCAHGISSRPATAHLRALGYRARSLAGGMAGWMMAVVERALPAPPGFDRFLQFDRVGKGSLGYLLASGGEALAIDVPRDARPYMAAARAAGAKIVAVADTHVHADYISGGPHLARALGVAYHLHPADNVYPYDGTPGRLEIAPLADGQVLAVGAGAVRVCHTPGHTEGSVTLVAERDGQGAALTGDFLFVRALGRPDLAGKAAAWTEELWASVERARREWPRGLGIHPAHYSGAGERAPDHSVGAPFGELLATNEPLRIADHDAFVAWIAARATPAPSTYPRIKAINVGLLEVDAEEADVLEAGRNECAVG